MKRILTLTLACMTIFALSNCSKDKDETMQEASYSGTFIVLLDEDTSYTTSITVDVIPTDEHYMKMVLHNVKFSNESSPLDMTLNGILIGATLNKVRIPFFGNEIHPVSNNSAIESNQVDRLIGSAENGKIEFSFLMGTLDIRFSGTIQ